MARFILIGTSSQFAVILPARSVKRRNTATVSVFLPSSPTAPMSSCAPTPQSSGIVMSSPNAPVGPCHGATLVSTRGWSVVGDRPNSVSVVAARRYCDPLVCRRWLASWIMGSSAHRSCEP